MFLSVNMKNLA